MQQTPSTSRIAHGDQARKNLSDRGQKKPRVLHLTPDTIPEELREQAQWMVWRLVRRQDRDRANWTKPPYDPRSGKLGDVTNPNHRTSFDAALAAKARYGCAGVSFVFTPDDPYAGVDIDKCRDPETGAIDDEAWAIIRALHSYTEISPSGTGVKIFVRGCLPLPPGDEKGGHRRGRVEMYHSGRQFTVTGHHLNGTPGTVNDAQAGLTMVYRSIFGVQEPLQAPPRAVPPATGSTGSMGTGAVMDDQEVIDRASNDAQGAAFQALWRGDTSAEDGDESLADFHFCGHLAFYTQDAAQIERIVRQSGLNRKKWDRKDYRDRTIARALERRTFYTPPPPEPEPEPGPRGAEEGSTDSRKGVFERVTDDDAYVVPGPILRLLLKDACLWEYHRRIGKVRAVLRPKREGEQAQIISLPPADRVLLETIAGIQQTAPTDTEATPRQRFFRDELADKTGLSPSTISVRVPDLAAKGLIDFESRKVLRTRKMANKRTGVLEDRIVEEREWWLGLQPVPRSLLHDVELKQGPKAKADADRKCCPQCGSRHLKATHFQCEKCGTTCTAEEAIKADEERRAAKRTATESVASDSAGDDEAVRAAWTMHADDEGYDPFEMVDDGEDDDATRNPIRPFKEGTARKSGEMFPGVPPLEPLDLSAHRDRKQDTSGEPPPYCPKDGRHSGWWRDRWGSWWCAECSVVPPGKAVVRTAPAAAGAR